MGVSQNYCSQNGGNVYRAPYYNRNPNIGPRIDSNLRQSPYGGFPKLGVLFFGGVPILRMIVCWGRYWGPLNLGNYHIGILTRIMENQMEKNMEMEWTLGLHRELYGS